jgi:hypothetical protein
MPLPGMPGMPMPGMPPMGGGAPGGGMPPGLMPPMGGAGPQGPTIQSPVGLPPELAGAGNQLTQFVKGDPGAAVIATGLIESMTKLIKMMTTVGEPKAKQTRVNPMAPNMSQGDEIAQHQAMPPQVPNPMSLLAGGRPPGL